MSKDLIDNTVDEPPIGCDAYRVGVINNAPPLEAAVWNPNAGKMLRDSLAPDTQDAIAALLQQPVQTSLDKQVGGEHYKRLKLQPWEIIDALDLDFYDGNALKYLLRWRKKGGVEDLKKAIHYIEHQIEKQEKQNVG